MMCLSSTWLKCWINTTQCRAENMYGVIWSLKELEMIIYVTIKTSKSSISCFVFFRSHWWQCDKVRSWNLMAGSARGTRHLSLKQAVSTAVNNNVGQPKSCLGNWQDLGHQQQTLWCNAIQLVPVFSQCQCQMICIKKKKRSFKSKRSTMYAVNPWCESCKYSIFALFVVLQRKKAIDWRMFSQYRRQVLCPSMLQTDWEGAN